MRKVTRLDLDSQTQRDLDARQTAANEELTSGVLNPTVTWQNARPSPELRKVHTILKRMMGERERCMYCLDSHGTDVEHFWPKTPFPARMFVWLNLLLCCAECGRFKGDRFPMAGGQPLLIDPTAEDPWIHLDFDPGTGNVVARFDPNTQGYSSKGEATVKALQLDRREAMAKGYQSTFKRLSGVVEKYLQEGHPHVEAMVAQLREADDHGLLGWCLCGSGQNEHPFSDFRSQHPDLWIVLLASV